MRLQAKSEGGLVGEGSEAAGQVGGLQALHLSNFIILSTDFNRYFNSVSFNVHTCKICPMTIVSHFS